MVVSRGTHATLPTRPRNGSCRLVCAPATGAAKALCTRLVELRNDQLNRF